MQAIGGSRVGTQSWGIASVMLGMEITGEKEAGPEGWEEAVAGEGMVV